MKHLFPLLPIVLLACLALPPNVQSAPAPERGVAVPPEGSAESPPLETNRLDTGVHDVPLLNVVQMFMRISGANLVACVRDLEGDVTVSFEDVHWIPALLAVLTLHDLALVECVPGSEVYTIMPRSRTAPSVPNVSPAKAATEAPVPRDALISMTADPVSVADVVQSVRKATGESIIFEHAADEGVTVLLHVEDSPWQPVLVSVLALHGMALIGPGPDGDGYRIAAARAHDRRRFREVSVPRSQLPAPAAPSKKQNLISVTLDQVPVRNTVQMFMRISGVNRVFCLDDLHGRCSVELEDADWLPALTTLLEPRGLSISEIPPRSSIYVILPRSPDPNDPPDLPVKIVRGKRALIEARKQAAAGRPRDARKLFRMTLDLLPATPEYGALREEAEIGLDDLGDGAPGW